MDGYLGLSPEGNIEINPNFSPFAYRIMLYDPVRKLYLSPFTAHKTGISESEKDYISTGDYPEKLGQAEDLRTLLKQSAEEFDKKGIDWNAINRPNGKKYDPIYDWQNGESYAAILLKQLMKGGGELASGIITDLGASGPTSAMRRVWAPNSGFSVIGFPRRDISLIRQVDIMGEPSKRARPDTKALEELIDKQANVHDLATLSAQFNGNPIYMELLKNLYGSKLFKDVIKPYYEKKGEGYMADYIDMSELVDILAGHATGALKDKVTSRGARGNLKRYIMEHSMNFIPDSSNGDFFANPDQEFRDAMHDTLVESIVSTLTAASKQASLDGYNPDNLVLLQVGAPVESLLTNDRLMNGDVAAQRDFMTELVVNRFKLMNKLGNIGNVLERGGPIWNYYANRVKGMTGEEAWKKAMGSEWGDLKYLLSDEEAKDAVKGLQDGLDGYIRNMAIKSGVSRGY